MVQANVLSEFQSFVSARNVDPNDLLATVGLRPEDITDPNRYIALNTVAELFDVAARRTGDGSFGVHYAVAFPKGGSGVLGHLMLSAPTVGDVLKVLVDYLEIHSIEMRALLESDGSSHAFYLSYPPRFTAPQLHYTDFLLTILILRLRLGAGAYWQPSAVEFAHRQPDDLALYQRYFGNRLTFDAPRYRVDIDAEHFLKPMPKLVDRLYDSMRDLGDRILRETRVRNDIVARTFTVLADQFKSEQPFELDSVASRLELTSRALQWRLEQAGTSYERLLEMTRRRLAVQLLRDTDLPMATIARRLGYSEPSSFARAAQGWFKLSPSVMRRRLRDGMPDSDEPKI